MRLPVTAIALLCCAAGAPAPASAQECAPEGDMKFVCGLEAVEDLVRVGETRWLVGSGLGAQGRPGTLVLVDATAKRGEVVYPATSVPAEPDRARFPACQAPPDAARFNAHGLMLRTAAGVPAGSARGGQAGRDVFELLVVNHGGREAVEFFQVDARGARPALRWIGCVEMPADTYINSLDGLPDGGFITTHFYSPSKGGIGAVFDREITGGLLEWHPGQAVRPIPGTDLSGANGILVGDGGDTVYVAAWGTRELVRFMRRNGNMTRVTAPVDFALDNLRWTSDGKLLGAGQKFVARREGPASLDGWTVAVYDPTTLALVAKLKDVDGTASFQGVSSALEVGDEIWVGPFRGDRIGYFPKPR